MISSTPWKTSFLGNYTFYNIFIDFHFGKWKLVVLFSEEGRENEAMIKVDGTVS